MSRIKIGRPCIVEHYGSAVVVDHGRDFFGVYTKILLEDGREVKVHPSMVRVQKSKAVAG